MVKYEPPTCEEIFDEELEMVEDHIDDSWRHGSHVEEIYKRKVDSTYWSAKYSRSTDGETHGLREGEASIEQVEPYTVITIEYRKVKN